MSATRLAHNKRVIADLNAVQYSFDEREVHAALQRHMADDVKILWCHPWSQLDSGRLDNADALMKRVYAPLKKAIPDLEKRDIIRISGTTDRGMDWVGTAGYYFGCMKAPWLDITPTGHLVHLRYHEFYRFEEGRICECHGQWDIPALMMQCRAWPMAPSLGVEGLVPAPATLDGLSDGPRDEQTDQRSCTLVTDMLQDLKRHPQQGGPELMNMAHYWHPKMSWYGPAGIGQCRGIDGFRNWHQIPFLKAMPDRGQYLDQITYHFFADQHYVGVTGWPNMIQTLSHDGWLGLPPVQKRITMSSLDFWRIEGEKIRENWVMLDMLDVYRQLGIDVLARMREFNKARIGFDPQSGVAL